MPLDWYAMVALFFVMLAVFIHIRIALFPRVEAAVSGRSLARRRGAALGAIRWEVAINLVLGIFIVVIGDGSAPRPERSARRARRAARSTAASARSEPRRALPMPAIGSKATPARARAARSWRSTGSRTCAPSRCRPSACQGRSSAVSEGQVVAALRGELGRGVEAAVAEHQVAVDGDHQRAWCRRRRSRRAGGRVDASRLLGRDRRLLVAPRRARFAVAELAQRLADDGDARGRARRAPRRARRRASSCRCSRRRAGRRRSRAAHVAASGSRAQPLPGAPADHRHARRTARRARPSATAPCRRTGRR